MGAYLRPQALDEAIAQMQSAPLVAAGCTDLFPATDRPDLTIGQDRDILDVTGIGALRGIRRTDAGIRVGATTSWSDILEADLPPACDGLKQAAREVGSIQIQNSATIAGNLCNASPAADGIPPLLTLDAKVELQSAAGIRELALPDFVTGPRQTARRSDELMTAIILPQTALRGVSSFRKLGARKYLVISIAMLAFRLEFAGTRIVRAAIAVGACSPVAVRLHEIEQALVEGREFDDADIDKALAPIDDIRADANYRRHAVPVLLRRSLAGLRSAVETAA